VTTYKHRRPFFFIISWNGRRITFAHLRSVALSDILKSERGQIAMKKTKIFLSQDEWRVVVNCLNEKRNSLIADGKYTDAVDDLLLKVMSAPTKKTKIA
jgi:hypothetical protein